MSTQSDHKITVSERDEITVGDIVTFEQTDHGKRKTGTVVYSGVCGLDVRVKNEIYYIYRSQVTIVKKA